MSNTFFEVNTQEAKSSLGFDVGAHILVKADAFLPKKRSYARCCTGVVTCVAELISVKLDPTQKFEAHCILVKPEWLKNWSGQTSVAESVPISPTPDTCTQNSTSSPPVTATTMLKTSCSSDTQKPSASEMFDCGHQSAKTCQPLNLLQQLPPVSPSPCKESDWALRTNETAFPPLLERSPTQNLDSSVSPCDGSCTSIPSCTNPEVKQRQKRSPNKQPATGSLARNVTIKKGKEYSTWQYSYSVRAPETKKGWRTVKEGVPKHLSSVVAAAILEGKPIREILGLLEKEPRGEISE